MKIRIVLLCFLAFQFFSCDIIIESSGEQQYDPSRPDYPTRTFWAVDFTNNRNYQLEAELLVDGLYCKIWAEMGANLSENDARRVANTYDNTIYPRMMDAFGIKGNITDDGVTIIARDIMEFASWLVDGDGKLSILLLNIRDGFKPGVSETLLAGYFWGGNFFENDPASSSFRYSNETDMIYINLNPQMPPGSMASNKTIAHELQHLMNFVSTFITGRTGLMDTWIDEGLSASAEWVVSGSQDTNYVAWFNNDPSEMIRRGNNFFVWDNHSNNPNAIIDEYATVYLFFQWLRLQAGSNGIFYNIISSSYHDHRAVTRAMNSAVPGRAYDNWETLLRTWLAANYINATSGPFGYMNDSALRNIQARTVPGGTTNLNLAPGEGVFSITAQGFSIPAQGVNIRYAGLNRSSPWLSDNSIFPGGALLSFNVNTDINGRTESGRTTGLAASEEIVLDDHSRQLLLSSRPFVISAADMLRRNGHEENSFTNLPSTALFSIIDDE